MRLLLLPGTLCDAEVWAPVVARLSGSAEPVVGDVGSHDSVEAIAAALLARHPGRLAVAGFSFGGFVALQMAIQAPARIAGLALIGTVALPLPPDQHPERRRRLAVGEAEGVGRYVRDLLPAYLHRDNLADPRLVEAITAMAERTGMSVLRRQVLANMARPDARPALGGLRVPTLVLCGEDAICLPRDHRAMAAAIPGAELVEVAGAGHFVTLERPAEVAAAMRGWVRRVGAAQT